MGTIKTKILSLVTAFLMTSALVSLLPQGALKASAITYYRFSFYNVRVTSKNAADILGDGSASYDENSKTLTIKKSVSGEKPFVSNGVTNLKIKTTQPLTLETSYDVGFYTTTDLSIETNGKLTIKVPKKEGSAIQTDASTQNPCVVTIKNADIEYSGDIGLYSLGGTTLNIIDSNIKLQTTDAKHGAISGFSNIHLTNCYLNTPEKACIDFGNVYTDMSRKTVATSVEICRSRLAGNNRYDTSAVISKSLYNKSSAVILASGTEYADALVGVPLASKLDAPILLTDPKTLSAETLSEIKRLGANHVTILGGEGAVSKRIESMLASNGMKVDRIQGATRFSTATAIANKLNDAPKDLVFVYGFDYADALSVSPAASAMGAPIIYLNKDGEMNAETAAYLAQLKQKRCVENIHFIGGEGVISKAMEKKAIAALGITDDSKHVKRAAGADRYETCIKVNAEFYSYLPSKMICVATGLDFPDALAGGVFAAKHASMLFLVNGKASGGLSEVQKGYIKDNAPHGMAVFGGTGAVTDQVLSSINEAIK